MVLHALPGPWHPFLLLFLDLSPGDEVVWQGRRCTVVLEMFNFAVHHPVLLMPLLRVISVLKAV